MSRTEGAGDERGELMALARVWQQPLEGAQTEALLAYARLLLAWNARINLTGARSMAALVGEHFPDAFALARRLNGPAQLVDVGSGGGLPALPLALLRPDLTVQLCEPIAKKVAFLRTAVRELGLADRFAVHAGRAEALAVARPRAFDAAVSRATFAPGAWVALGQKLVKPGGRLFVLTVPDELPDEPARDVYLGGRRVLVEIPVP